MAQATDANWTVRADTGNERTCESRADAERIAAEMEQLGVEVDLIPPGGDVANGLNEPETATTTEVVSAEEAAERLPERNMSDDPLEWIPAPFVDTIDGEVTLNRKGFEVLGHYYEIAVESDIIVPPEETDFQFCRAKATATTPDGVSYEAHGSAHVDRGDEHTLLLELADTRACKRAMSAATGVGAIAVEELKNDIDGGD